MDQGLVEPCRVSPVMDCDRSGEGTRRRASKGRRAGLATGGNSYYASDNRHGIKQDTFTSAKVQVKVSPYNKISPSHPSPWPLDHSRKSFAVPLIPISLNYCF